MAETAAIFEEDVIRGARSGGTWWQIYVKRELQQHQPEKGFSLYREVMAYPPKARLARHAIESIQQFAQASAAVYSEIEPAGESFELIPGPVLGVGNHRIISGRTRTLYVAAIDQVRLRGRSQLMQHAGRIFLDFEGDEFDRIDDEIELDSAVYTHAGRQAGLIEDETESKPLEAGECFSLLGPNSVAFGHWIAEYLPRLAAALASGRMPPVTVLIDANLPRQHRESLELLIGSGSRIVEVAPQQRIDVGRLWFSPTYYYAPILARMNGRYREETVSAPPARFARLARFMAARYSAVGACRDMERVFLARRARGHRILCNAGLIQRVAEEFGFVLVYPEDMPFAEQIRVIRGARYVVGPEGSAQFLAFFANPGTRIAILNHQHTELLTGVTAQLHALEMEVTVVTGPIVRRDPDYVHHSDYIVDESIFRRFLKDWLPE